MPLLDSDLTELCFSILNGNLDSFSFKWKNESSCAPVVVVDGYPESYNKGAPIAINQTGLNRKEAKIFIAGAKKGEGGALGSGLRTSGGRVLSVCTLGVNGEKARENAYEALGFIDFEGMTYRKDIGLSSQTGNSEVNNE